LNKNNKFFINSSDHMYRVYLFIYLANGYYVGWGGERRVQGFGGETLGKETSGETQA
jgi:hypothetical protein